MASCRERGHHGCARRSALDSVGESRRADGGYRGGKADVTTALIILGLFLLFMLAAIAIELWARRRRRFRDMRGDQ
jgi:hypothetical protein